MSLGRIISYVYNSDIHVLSVRPDSPRYQRQVWGSGAARENGAQGEGVMGPG